MLKMFIVVSVLGQVYGTAGPLDYSMWQCPMVLTIARQHIDRAIDNGVEFNGHTVKRGETTAKCVMARKRPHAPHQLKVS